MTLSETKPRLFAFLTVGPAVLVLALAVLYLLLVLYPPASAFGRRSIEPDRPPGSSAVSSLIP